jgi:folate-dependent phosphoribosylglycinamide formyltransferase PurN
MSVNPNPKIIVLAQDSITTKLVVYSLSKRFTNVKVGIEDPVPMLKFLQSRINKLGFITVFGQVLFVFFSRVLSFISFGRVQSILLNAGFKDINFYRYDSISFLSVNSKECVDWLSSEKPDVVVLNGTRIVGKDLLNSTNTYFINIHCGITPAYRGVHGSYWALANNDFCNNGVTIHLVDEGVDTGDIVFQKLITVDKSDNYVTYPYKQYIVGIPLLLDAVDLALRGLISSYKRDDIPSKLYYHPTFFQYVYNFFKSGVK